MQITYFEGQEMKVKEFKPLESEIMSSPGPLFNFGEKLDYTHLADVYSDIIEAAGSSNVNYMIAVNYFYMFLETGKVPHAFFEEILDYIKKTRPTNPDIFYAQGINYFHNADSKGELELYNGLDGEYLRVYVQDKEYSRAIECFEQAILRDPNNAELYYLLAGCLAAIGKIGEAFNLLTEADALRSSFDPGATKYLNKGLRTALRFIISKLILEDKYDDAYEIGNRLSNLQPLDQHSCVVLDMIFRKYGKYIDAIKMWSLARRLYPSEILPLHFIGINLTQMHKFYFASRYFFRELKIIDDYIRQKGFGENNRLIAQILFDHTLGMYYWKQGQTEEARKHFNTSAELIKANNLENYRPFTVLPELMEVDAEIGLLSSSANCEEFSKRLDNATENMGDLLKRSGYYPEEIISVHDEDLEANVEVIKETIDYLSSTSIYLERLIRTKNDFLIALLIISAKGGILLQTVDLIKRLIPYWDEKATNINNELDFLKKVEDKINIQIDSLNEMGYVHEADAFTALLKYSRKLGIRAIEKVSVEEWPEIMDSLRIPLKNIGESYTADSLSQIINLSISRLNINIIWESRGGAEQATQTIESREEKHGEKEPADLKTILEIDFSDKKVVTVDNTKYEIGLEGFTQEFILLEELLNKNEIHWTAGFILFEDWQDKVPKAGPVEQFQVAVSKLNNILGRRHAIISPVRLGQKGKPKIWKLGKSIKIIKNTIETSKEKCNEAKKSENIDQALVKVMEALSFYPRSIKTNLLFVDLLQRKGKPQDIDEGKRVKLLKAIEVLHFRRVDLSSAIKMIEAEIGKYDRPKYWNEALSYINEMGDELNEIQQTIILGEKFIDKLNLSTEEAECLATIKMMRDIRAGESHLFVALAKAPPIIKCIENVIEKLKDVRRDQFKDYSTKEIRELAFTVLGQIVSKNDICYMGVFEFEKYIIGAIFRELFDRLKDETSSATEEAHKRLGSGWFKDIERITSGSAEAEETKTELFNGQDDLSSIDFDSR